MIRIFTSNDFKSMQWKNGGGTTTELFKISTPDSQSFLLRLSRAEIMQDGPFSIFPNIDRCLVLIDGNGFSLKNPDLVIDMEQKLSPYYFKGEEHINCSLKNGPCVDFNIMTDRNYAQSAISIFTSPNDNVISFQADCDLKFIYDLSNDTLYKLEISDSYKLAVKKNLSLIVIDVKLI